MGTCCSKSKDSAIEKPGNRKPQVACTLSSLHREDGVEYLGGKVWNSARLVRANLPVPPALSISTEAYDEATRDCGATATLAHVIRDPTNSEAVLAKCRDDINGLTVSPKVSAAIEEFLKSNAVAGREKSYAVRSSATVEDSGDSAFAGQFETYLHNKSLEDVLTSLKKCWASMFAAHLLPGYQRVFGGQADASPHMAVLIQEQIDSEVAGVMFCQNPFTGSTSEFMINACFGQGHGVVEGEMPTDQYIVKSDGSKIKSKHIAQKTEQWALSPKGGIEKKQIIEDSSQKQSALTDDQIFELAKLGREITQAYKSPQDVEWAVANNQIYILQARPITAVGEQLEWHPAKAGTWERDDHFNRPLSKLNEELQLRAWQQGVNHMCDSCGLVLDTIELTSMNGFLYICRRIMGKPTENPDHEGLPPKCVIQVTVAIDFGYSFIALIAVGQCMFGKCCRSCCLSEIGDRFDKAERYWADKGYLKQLEHWDKVDKPRIVKGHLEFGSKDSSLSQMTEQQLKEELVGRKDWFLEVAPYHHRLTAPAMLPNGDFFVIAKKLTDCSTQEAAKCLGGASALSNGIPGEFPEFTQLLKDSVPANKVLDDPDISGQQKVDTLLSMEGPFGESMRSTYAHFCNRVATGYDIADGNFRTMPDLVVATLKGVIRYTAVPADQHPAQAAIAELRKKVPPEKAKLFDDALADARAVARLRDERALYNDLWAAGIMHNAVLEAGRRAVDKGLLSDAALLLDATFDEITAAVEGRLYGGGNVTFGLRKDISMPAFKTWQEFEAELKRRRKHRTTVTIMSSNSPKYVMWHPDIPHMSDPAKPWVQSEAPPPIDWIKDCHEGAARTIAALITSFDTVLKTETEANDDDSDTEAVRQRQALIDSLGPNSFTGFGAASAPKGNHIGKAKIVIESEDLSKCEPGDVLVTVYGSSIINNVLPFIGAIVTDGGGVLSHAAICCRESSLNCVVGSLVATKRLNDGDRVEVDGKNGIVTILGADQEAMSLKEGGESGCLRGCITSTETNEMVEVNELQVESDAH